MADTVVFVPLVLLLPVTNLFFFLLLCDVPKNVYLLQVGSESS